MRTLLVTNYYPPEIGGGVHIVYELALSLKARGHQVTVLTGYPRYNIKEVPARYRAGLRLDETLEGIRVRRIRIPAFPRASKLMRGVEHFIIGLWLGGLMCLTRRADVAMVGSPPLPLAWLVCLVGKVRRIPVVINLQDLFPREAVELGMLTNPVLIHLFEGIERQIYRLAAGVSVHSPGNRQHVIERGGKPERVSVVHNWVDTERIQPGPRDNGFAHQHDLMGRFVVSYAGTMGWAQDMGTIIASAARLRDRRDILFLLVGDGVEKEKAQAQSAELGLHNVMWLPMQPWAVYPEILAASDVSLINLHPELRTPVVPSKLLSIMAAARPVVASLPPESDARRIVADAGCGICVEAGDDAALAEAVLKVASNPDLLSDMGRLGRAYVEAHFSRPVCVGQMEAVFRKAAGVTL